MAILTSDDPIVGEILNALGLDGVKWITGVSLDIRAGAPIVLNLQKFVIDDELKKISSLIKKNHVSVVDENHVAASFELASDDKACLNDLALLVKESRKENRGSHDGSLVDGVCSV